MAKYSNTVEYNIKTSLDSKGLTQLKTELQGLELKLQNMGNKGLLDEKTFSDARNQIQGLGQALTDAFNPSLGMLDLSKLNQELKNNDVTTQGLKTAFTSLGAEGQVAFNNLVGELGKLDTGILRTNSQIDKLFTTFSNTFRWGLVSSFFSNFMNSIHQSVDYVKELDDSLTQIMLVTDYNRDAMNQYAKSANEAAKAVSMTTTGMTNASLIFAQQGYNLNQSQELATLSAKLANASQQDTATTSDQITAYMNAYGLQNSMEELTQQMDNWALIANISAADVGELAQASQRAASMANAVGVSGEQLAAQIATIESVTREAPEQIGNGLKTLYARFSDIEAGGEDEEGFTLGKITSQLNAIGVQILDQFGNIRDVGDIMEDLMVIWDDLDQTSKVAASQALAGKYQVNRFMALMDNSGMYQEYKGATGSAATGTLDQMSEEYADSIAGRSAKLQASLEGLFSTIFNTDDIYPWMDAAQGAIDLLQQFFDALGGGKTVLLGISSLLMQIFSKNVAQEINNAALNRAVQQQKLENLQNSGAALSNLGLINPNIEDQNARNILNFSQYMNEQALAGNFNPEQMNQANNILAEMIQNSNAATMAADELKNNLSTIGTAITAISGDNTLPPFLDEQGAVNASELMKILQQMDNIQIRDFFSDLEDKIGPVKKDLLDFNSAIQKYQKELNNADSTSESFENAVNEMKAALDRLQGELDVDTYNRYEQALDEISNKATDAKGDTSKLAIETAKLAEELAKVSEKDLRNLDHLDQQAFKVKTANSAAEDSGKVAGAFKEGMNSQQQIKNILDTLNAVQQLTFAWQAFQNLGSLWANEDLSKGEKVLQTIMNLTMAMPQLIFALQSIKGTQIFDSIGNLFSAIPEIGNTANIQGIQQLLDMQNKGVEAYDKMMEAAGENSKIADGLEDIWRAGEKATETLGSMDQELVELVKNGGAANTELTGVAKIFADGMAASLAEGATGAGLFAGGLKAVGMAAAKALIPLLPYLAIGAAIAGIAFIIGQEAEKAKQAHEEALTTLEDAKNVQQQIKDLSSQIDEWQSKRNEQGNTKELAQDADALADSLKELGNEEEAVAIHLAAIRAKALDTSESFEELNQVIEKAQFNSQNDADLATMDAANAILKDRLSTTEELAAAQKDLQNAALDYNLRNLAQTNGMEMGILNTPGNEDLHAATMDWQSLNSILEHSVPGFKEITDENERLSLALAHTSDEAQRAAIEIQQLLNANSSLSSSRTTDYGAGDIGNFNEREGITRQLENTGLTAEESLQLLITVDDSSYETMTQDIQTVMEHLNNGEPFGVAVKAIMDEEESEEYVKSQLAAYEPKDEDIDKETFDSLAETFYENQNQMGLEGTPFEYYSEDLFSNAEALEDVIEGILRYNDAIESLDENYDNWKDILENTNELSTEHLRVVDNLQETYSDFLGLSKKVSKNFASNAKNLELMQEAVEGNTEAFEDLENAAAADIYMQITGIEDLEIAENKIQEINDILANSGIEEIPIGEIFNLEDFPEVREAINNELQALELDAEAAAKYVQDVWHLDIPADQFAPIEDGAYTASQNAAEAATSVAGVVEGVTDTIIDNGNFSMHTDVQSDTATKEDQIAYTNLKPMPGPTTTIESTFPVGNANPTASGSGAIETQTAIAEVTGVTYEPIPITESQVKEMTGYGMETKVEKGNGKGGVSLPSNAQASRRPSSGLGRSSASRPSSGKSSGKGSGGGGGGSKAKTIQPKEKKDHQKDYYEEVNGQLNKTEKILSKIEKEEDRLIGDKARANQNKQLKLLQKEIDLNNKKLSIQKQELSDVDELIKDQDELAEKTAKNAGITNFSIPDIVLDADGIVSNYEQISKRIDDIHNDLIDKYNKAAAAGNEELTKQLEKTISQFDKYGESLLKGTQRHNELKAEIEGTIGELENLDDAIEDIRIDAWKDSTEAIDNLKELRENAAELEGFFSEYESDSPFRALIVDSEKLNNIWSIGKEEAKEYYNEIIAGKEEALKKTKDKDERAAIQTSINYFKNLRDNLSDTGLNNGLLGYAFQDLQQLQKWYENPKAKDNPFGDNTAALRDAYNESLERFQQLSEEAEKTAEDYRDDIIDAYDYIEDQQDRQIDKFDRVIDRLEHFSDMYALYYGDESYDMMRDVLQQQGNTLREQLNQQKTVYEYWVNQYAQVLETGDEKLIQEIEDKMNDAADKIAELAEDAAKTFADSYENAVKASVQHMNQAVFGDKNLNRLERNWEWDKEYIEKYRDDVEKAYEMDKLRNKYTDLLNQAQGASLQTQDKIRAQMQEQLALLDGQKTVSEYDVKLANAKLEILQKQIALEDAQRNKNQMKLRRDTQGNYRYVYTANQNDVSGAQQDLLNSEYDAYEISKNQQIQNYDDTINTWNRFQTQLTEIWTNANLTSDQKLQESKELYDRYSKSIEGIGEDIKDAMFGTIDSLNWMLLNGTEYTSNAALDMLNTMLDEQGRIKDETEILWIDNATFISEEVIPKISGAVAEADEDIRNRLTELESNLVGENGVIPHIVSSIEGEDGLTTALNEARTSTDGLAVSTENLMEKLAGNNESLAKAQAELQEYVAELNNVKNASSIAANTIKKMQKQLDQSEAEKLNYLTDLDKLKSGKYEFDNKGNVVEKQKNQSKNISNAKSQGTWSAKDDAYQIWMNGKWGGGGYWYGPYKADGHTEAQADAVLALFNSGYGYEWMDTGGYTGTWKGNEGMSNAKNGKLAVLHQKELVLNSEDTKNILAAVDIVRQIGTGLRNSMSNMNLPFGKALNTIGNTIEQRVEITASFPNATDADDIRQALIGLSDKAYQYAHRTI